MTERPRRPRPLPPETVAKVPRDLDAVSEADLVDRLTEAVAALPREERAAAVVAFGLDEDSAGVAEHLDLDPADAEALTRSAVQLLRGALADLKLDDGVLYARLHRHTGGKHEAP